MVKEGTMTDKGPPAEKQEVRISFVRSKNGKIRRIPVWFTLNKGKMELLPVYGLRTKWLIDVEKSGKLSLEVGSWKKDARPRIVRDRNVIESVKRRFSVKYGERDVKRYYPKQDVALEILL